MGLGASRAAAAEAAASEAAAHTRNEPFGGTDRSATPAASPAYSPYEGGSSPFHSPVKWVQTEATQTVDIPRPVLESRVLAPQQIREEHDLVMTRCCTHEVVQFRAEVMLWLARKGGAEGGVLASLPWLEDPGEVLDTLMAKLDEGNDLETENCLRDRVTLMCEGYHEDEGEGLTRAEAARLIYDLVTEELILRRDWLPVYSNWSLQQRGRGQRPKRQRTAAEALATSRHASDIDAMLRTLWLHDHEICNSLTDWIAEGAVWDQMLMGTIEDVIVGHRCGAFYRHFLITIAQKTLEQGFKETVPCRPISLELVAPQPTSGISLITRQVKHARRDSQPRPMLCLPDLRIVARARSREEHAQREIARSCADAYLQLIEHAFSKLSDWVARRPVLWGRTPENCSDTLVATLRIELLDQKKRPHHGLASLFECELRQSEGHLDEHTKLFLLAYHPARDPAMQNLDVRVHPDEYLRLLHVFVTACGSARRGSVLDAQRKLCGCLGDLVDVIRKGTLDPTQRNLPKAAVLLRDDPLISLFVNADKDLELRGRLHGAEPAAHLRRWRHNRARIAKAWFGTVKQDLFDDAPHGLPLHDFRRVLFGPQMLFALLQSVWLCVREEAISPALSPKRLRRVLSPQQAPPAEGAADGAHAAAQEAFQFPPPADEPPPKAHAGNSPGHSAGPSGKMSGPSHEAVSSSSSRSRESRCRRGTDVSAGAVRDATTPIRLAVSAPNHDNLSTPVQPRVTGFVDTPSVLRDADPGWVSPLGSGWPTLPSACAAGQTQKPSFD